MTPRRAPKWAFYTCNQPCAGLLGRPCRWTVRTAHVSGSQAMAARPTGSGRSETSTSMAGCALPESGSRLAAQSAADRPCRATASNCSAGNTKPELDASTVRKRPTSGGIEGSIAVEPVCQCRLYQVLGCASDQDEQVVIIRVHCGISSQQIVPYRNDTMFNAKLPPLRVVAGWRPFASVALAQLQ